MPLAAEPAEVKEAQRLLGALNHLIENVGEAYVELSGQTAAMQAVVADVRRCNSFLQNRLVGEPPPAPWLTASSRGAYTSASSPAATPPTRRASTSQENAQAPGSTAPLGSVPKVWSPSPERASSSTAGGGGPRSVAGKGVVDPSSPASSQVDASPATATGTSTATRPPLPSGSSGAGGRAGSVGRAGPGTRTPSAGARSHANLTPAERPSGHAGVSRTRDASLHRRTGVRTASGTTTAVPAQPRSGLPGTGTTSQARELAHVGISKPGSAGSSSAKSDQAQGDANHTDAGIISTSSHLPLAAQRALAAAAALGAGVDGSSPQDYQYDSPCHPQQQGANADRKPGGPPQLPLALRRAMHRYRETLKTRDQLLQQHQERRGGSSSSGICGGTSLADTVTMAGNAYRSALARQLPHIPAGDRSNSSSCGGGGGGRGKEATSQAAEQFNRMSLGASPVGELRRRAQVVFAALVAAQTWLIQSLSELARTRGTHGGVAAANRRTTQADTCAALLADVELLRIELDDLQTQLRAAAQSDMTTPTLATSLAASQAAATTVGVHGCMVNSSNSRSNRSIDALAGMAVELGVDSEELEEAAALWRNRFLRSLLCDGSGPAASSGRRGPAAPGSLQKLSQPAKQLQQPCRDGLAVAAGDARSCMRRPVGFWLPDAVWAHVPIPAGGEASAVAAGAGAAAPESQANSLRDRAASSATPWHVLLPSPPPMVAKLASAGVVQCMMAPPALLCSSVQDAVAHGRAQLQLQATAFQLLLEGSLAAPLLPQQRPPSPPVRAQMTVDSRRRQQLHDPYTAEAAALAWERWLAQCRLAHLLLLKGAWNRLCSIAEIELEGEPGDEIGEQQPLQSPQPPPQQ